jgi:hypothetical protein
MVEPTGLRSGFEGKPGGVVLRGHVIFGVPIDRDPFSFIRVRRTPREEQMSKKSRDLPVAARRNFLKGAALTGAAALTPAVTANAQVTAPRAPLTAAAPGPKLIAVETTPPAEDPVTSSGGEFMVDVLKTLNIDYLAMNCASSFRGVHEAIINHGNNKPEILTCPHEEIAVHMAQGYAKIEGKPILAPAFRRVGGARLQDCNDAANGSGAPLARRRAAGKSDRRSS